jgi:hypothetical protein
MDFSAPVETVYVPSVFRDFRYRIDAIDKVVPEFSQTVCGSRESASHANDSNRVFMHAMPFQSIKPIHFFINRKIKLNFLA